MVAATYAPVYHGTWNACALAGIKIQKEYAYTLAIIVSLLLSGRRNGTIKGAALFLHRGKLVNILQRLYKVKELPSIPEVVMRVEELIESGDYGAAALSRIIEQDPALSSKILMVANSVHFGAVNSRISSVQLAIARLGVAEVRQIVLATGFIKQFGLGSAILDYPLFWRHSLTVAFMSRMLGDICHLIPTENHKHLLFTAGLLHDCGILIYDQFFHKEFQLMVDASVRHEKSYLSVEAKVPFYESHSFIGSSLMEMWKMHPAVISAVRFHHHPEKAPEGHSLISYIVHLAECVVNNWRLGSFEGPIETVAERTWEKLGLAEDTKTELIVNAESEVSHSDMVLALEMANGVTPLRYV